MPKQITIDMIKHLRPTLDDKPSQSEMEEYVDQKTEMASESDIDKLFEK